MKRQAITTIEQAIGFLRTIDVEVIGTTGGWIVRGVTKFSADIDVTCDSDAELIDYARAEQAFLVESCRKIGLKSPAEFPSYSSCSSAAAWRMVLLGAWVCGLIDFRTGKGGKK